jgi:nicotinamidase-related amidase
MCVVAATRIHHDRSGRVSTLAGAAGRSKPVEEQEAAIQHEAGRLEQHGATRQDWIAEMGKHFMVMLDPEGNEFCLT